MKQTLKQIIPPSLWNFARGTSDTIRRLPELPAAYLHPWRRESIRRLAALRDSHKGKRAFIIGNGPSLRQTDLSKLRNEFTFGMNRIYLLFPELGVLIVTFRLTYHLPNYQLFFTLPTRDRASHPMYAAAFGKERR